MRGQDARGGCGRPLRGRHDELSIVAERIARARAGEGAVIVVEGAPGIGKSRLLDEAASIARRAGLRVARGQADEADQVVPLSALLAALSSGSPPLLTTEHLRVLDPRPDQRYWLLQELEALLEALALRGPLLLALDDLQWADAATVLALRTLPPRLAPVPVLWLLAVRSASGGPNLRTALARLLEAGADRIVLGPLSEEAVSELTEDRLQAAAEPRLLRLAGHSGGNPFLLVELLDGLREEGLVRIEHGRAQVVAEQLPARVRDGMRDRLDRLSPEAREAIQVASVLGRRFSVDRLAAVAGRTPAELLGPIDQIMRADLIAEADQWLSFRHDLVREAVLESVPGPVRAALQRHAARVLQAAGASAVEVAPLLLAGAALGDADAVATLRAAARELASTQPAAAADITWRALELVRADDAQRGVLVADTVLRLYAAGRSQEAQTLAAREFERLPPVQEAEVRLNLSLMFGRSPVERAKENRLALALDGLPAGLRAQHLARLAYNIAVSGRYREAWMVAGVAAKGVRDAGEASAEPTLRTGVAVLEYARERYEQAIEILGALTPHPARGPEDPRADIAAMWHCDAQAVLDGLGEALAATGAGLAAAEREGQAWAVQIWLAWRGRLQFHAGRLDDARANLEAALAMADVVGDNPANAAALVALGRIGLHTGDEGLMRTALLVGAERLDEAPPSARRPHAWLRALEAMAHGEPVRALEEILPDDGQEPSTGLPSLPRDVTDEPQLVRIALAAGDEARAREAVERSERRAADHPAVATIAGVAAHARGLLERDVETLAHAVEHLRSGTRPLALASALEDAGSVAAAGGGRDGAVPWLGEALEAYVHLGAAWDAARSRRKLRDLGVRRRIGLRTRPERGWSGLTESELRVARLAASGLTNRQIAERLFISPHTVSSHLRHAFAKLAVSSRIELARIVAENDRPTA